MSGEKSKEAFAKNLRKYLDSRGMQDKDLIPITGASQTAVSEWLNAKKFPRIDKIEKIANFFGVKKSDLIEEPQEDERQNAVDEFSKKFMSLDEDQRRIVEILIDSLATHPNKQ